MESDSDEEESVDGVKKTYLCKGAWFGERLRDFTVITDVDSELAVLSAVDYMRILKLYPRLHRQHEDLVTAIEKGKIDLADLAYKALKQREDGVRGRSLGTDSYRHRLPGRVRMGSSSPVGGRPVGGELPEGEEADCEEEEEADCADTKGATSMSSALLAPTTSCSSSSSSALPMKEKSQDESVDRQIAACSEGGAPRSETRLRAVEDPALSFKPSRDWKAEIQKIRASDPKTSDEEKIRILHEALQQRIDETRAHEEVKASIQKRLETLQSDRERCDAEAQRLSSMKGKLEGCCREQKDQMNSMAKE
eukprot:g5139.t1